MLSSFLNGKLRRSERIRTGVGGGGMLRIHDQELRQHLCLSAGFEQPFQQNGAERIRYEAESRLDKRYTRLAVLERFME